MLKSVLLLDPPDHTIDDLREAFAESVPSACKVEIVDRAEELTARVGGAAIDQLVIVHAARGDGQRPGLQIIAELRAVSKETPIVAFADEGNVDSVANAVAAGANDFLVRGPQLSDRVSMLLGKMQNLFDALDRAHALDVQNAELQAAIQARFRMVGESSQLRDVIRQISTVAKLPRPLLIVGERGTGKELVARAIHFASGNTAAPIITINCAAFSDALLESELFGHEKGAFTGADETRDGKFAQADGGTLFLDEIGHMSLPFQRKILRVVEYGTYARVGGHQELTTKARVIAATNVDLRKKIKAGEFLSDLYDRLAFEVIRVPPLRDRNGDIELLARHFLEQFALEIPQLGGKTLSRAAIRALRRYRFPGNVRELKNLIERAAYRDTTNEITPEDVGVLDEIDWDTGSGTFQARVDAFRRRILTDAMKAAEGNQAEAARQLGLTYHQFRYYYGKLVDKPNSVTSAAE